MAVREVEDQAKSWRADVRTVVVNGPRLRKSFMTNDERWQSAALFPKGIGDSFDSVR